MIERRFVPMLKERDIPYSIDIFHTETDPKTIAEKSALRLRSSTSRRSSSPTTSAPSSPSSSRYVVVLSLCCRHTPFFQQQGSVSKYIQKYSHQPVIVLDERVRQSIDVQRASVDKKAPEPVPEFKSTFA